ncbi:MAG: hypothetical protein Q4P28_02135 [Tissierellia bacterium]|nr:hypothetical protein [Tissierellia bacterium]
MRKQKGYLVKHVSTYWEYMAMTILVLKSRDEIFDLDGRLRAM